jgi:hypothetical protein
LGVCGAALAHNATDVMKFHCSTAIMVAGTELPAGDNTIQVLDTSRGNVVLLVRSESGAQALVLVNRLNSTPAHGNDAVTITLQRRGNVYTLDQIWLPDHTGFEVLRSGIE